jgi:hypothetical protein
MFCHAWISGDTILNFKDYVTSSSTSRDMYGVLLIAPPELRLADLGLVEVVEFKLLK